MRGRPRGAAARQPGHDRLLPAGARPGLRRQPGHDRACRRQPGHDGAAVAVRRSRLGSSTAASARPFGAADTAFGLDLLRAWCRSQPRSNIVFSPASLASGLGLAYLGARGATAAAMARVLHLPVAGGRRLEAGLRARQSALGRLDGPGVTVDGSNRVWAWLVLAVPAQLPGGRGRRLRAARHGCRCRRIR